MPDLADVQKLLARAEAQAEGPAKLALFEEAVARADLLGDPDLGYAVRRKLLWPAYRAGRPDVLLVHFAWCLGHADRHPDQYAHDMLWSYRWVASSMPAFPQLPRPQIENAVADMARRYHEAGCSPRPVHVMRRLVYEDLGDAAAARDANRRIDRCARDVMADSPETEVKFRACFLLFVNQTARAVAEVNDFLTGAVADEEPYYLRQTQSRYLVPLVRVGRGDEARALQKKGYPVLRTAGRYADGVAHHVEYLALVGDVATAVRVVERHLPALLGSPSHLYRFTFLRSARFLVDRLRAAGRDGTTVRAPAGFVPAGEAERLRLDDFAAWVSEQLAAVAARFDARNGNGYHAGHVAKLAELNTFADRLARRGDARE